MFIIQYIKTIIEIIFTNIDKGKHNLLKNLAKHLVKST